MTTYRLKLRIAGRVQGVGFRWFVANEARRIGVGGYVRNRTDGSVEVEAEGEEGPLSELEAACRRGPSAARVEEVRREMTPASATAASNTSFEIR